MPKPYLTRENVHAWSEEIGENAENNQATLTRLLRDQRRLSKFADENAESLSPVSAGVVMYLTSVIVALFDRSGRLRNATWAQIREASARVGGAVDGLLPIDDDFPGRVREVSWRAQPHILDEALMALFERDEKSEKEEELAPDESLKIFLLLWVFTEALDVNWKPGKGIELTDAYTYVHIDPKPAE